MPDRPHGNSTQIARKLRKSSTEAEIYLWRHLRSRQLEGCKFRRQQPLGPYIVGFVSFEKRLVVELDGGQHALQKDEDQIRDGWLKSEGFEVLRFWNNEVFENSDGVLAVIRSKLLSTGS